MNSDMSIRGFAKRFLTGKLASWYDVPRRDTIVNFGHIISLCIYRQPPFQVELFIVPNTPSSFTNHRHPHVDAMEFPLAGNSWLHLNGTTMWSEEQIEQWLQGEIPTRSVYIDHKDWHEGGGSTPYAFLSIQKWRDDVELTSVGIDWEGELSSTEHAMMWQRYMSAGSQMLA